MDLSIVRRVIKSNFRTISLRLSLQAKDQLIMMRPLNKNTRCMKIRSWRTSFLLQYQRKKSHLEVWLRPDNHGSTILKKRTMLFSLTSLKSLITQELVPRTNLWWLVNNRWRLLPSQSTRSLLSRPMSTLQTLRGLKRSLCLKHQLPTTSCSRRPHKTHRAKPLPSSQTLS